MTHMKLPTFPNHFIGFDSILRELEEARNKVSNKIASYPPHNIIKNGENDYIIELAIAGYKREDLDIFINEDHALVVEGRKGKGEVPDEAYIERGISGKAFTKTFNLKDDIEVKDCTYVDGLLTVSLQRNVVEPEIQRINIK